jgi:hypothetical protein
VNPAQKGIIWSIIISVFVVGVLWNLLGNIWMLVDIHSDFSCFSPLNLFLIFIIQVAIYLAYFFVVRYALVTKEHSDGFVRRLSDRINNDLHPNLGSRLEEELFEEPKRTSGISDVPVIVEEAHPPLFIEGVKVCDICHEDFDNEGMAENKHCRHTFHSSCLKANNVTQSKCPFCRRSSSKISV